MVVKGTVRGLSLTYADGTERIEILTDKRKAAGLPYEEGMRIPVNLAIDDSIYQAGLRATKRCPVVWICANLEDHRGEKARLADVLARFGLAKNEVVRLVVSGLTIRIEKDAAASTHAQP